MAVGTLIDTDIMTDVLRGYVPAAHYLRGSPEPFSISAISVAELFQHVKDGGERGALAGLLSVIDIIPIDAAIAERAGVLRRDYGESHRVTTGDAIIAATAERFSLMLATLHPRHFPSVKRITTPYRKP
jgi:predicted nucleic acid-binding protein